MRAHVTVRDIAREVDLHFTTVARALKNHPRIPEATRKRVKEVATRLGYKPDPILAALNAYRKTVRRPHYQATLAWIDNWTSKEGMFGIGEFREYFSGAQYRATELGYKIEQFHMRESGMTPAKLQRILKARNIQGVIMPPQQSAGTIFDFDMTGFSAVALGYSLAQPTLHVVTNHQFRTILLMIRHVDQLGYRRVGVCIGNEWDEKVGHNWKAGLALVDDITEKSLDIVLLSPRSPEDLAARLPALSLEALIGYSDLHKCLSKYSSQIPPFASLSVLESDTYYSGTLQNSTMIGRKAVDIVVDMIHRNETGCPEQPVHTLIDSVWKTGQSLPLHNSLSNPTVRSNSRRIKKT